MATEISGGGIYWKSGLDNSDFKKGEQEIVSGFQRIEKAAKKSGDVLGKSISSKLGANAVQNIAILERELAKYEKTLEKVSGSTTLGGKGFEELKSQIRALYSEIDRQQAVLAKGGGISSTVIGETEKVVVETTKGASGIQKVVSGAWGFLRTAANLIPGLGLAGLIGVIITGLKALWDEFSKGGGALSDFKKNVEITSEALRSTPYIEARKNIAELRNELKLAKEGKIDAKKAIDNYNDSLGKATGGVRSLGEMERKLNELAPAHLEMIELKTKATIAYNKAAEEGVEADVEAANFGGYKTAMLAFLKNPKQWFNPAASSDLFRSTLDNIAKGRKAEEDLNKLGDRYQARAAEIANKYKLNFFNDTDASIKKAQGNSRKLHEIDEKRLALLNKINQSAEKFQFLDKDENQIAQINSFFDGLRSEVEKFNRDPKNKVKLGFDDIEKNRAQAISDADYNQETKALLNELEVRKKEYQDYEEFKKKVGEDVANKQYAELITKHKSYLERLQAEEDVLANKEGGLSALENTRYKQIQDERIKAQVQQKTDESKHLAELLAKYATYEQQKKALREQYEKDIIKLSPGQQAERKRQYDEDVANLDEAEAKKLISVKKYADEAIYTTKLAVRQQLEILNEAYNQVGLSPEAKAALKGRIDEVTKLLSLSDSELTSTQIDSEINKKQAAINELAKAGKQGTDEFKRLNDELMRLKQEKLNYLTDRIDTFRALSSAVGQLGNALSSLGDSSPALASIGNALQSVSSSADLFLTNWEKLANGTLKSADKIQMAATFIVNALNDILQSVQQNKLKEAEALQNVIDFQRGYNLALIEEQKIREEMANNVFYKDSMRTIRANLSKQISLVKEYDKAMKDLEEGQVKVGTKKAKRDWARVGASTAAGAGTGAVIGATGAGVLSVPGAIIGGAVGFIGGMLEKRKVVDVYDNLLKKYPLLIDAEGNLNDAMAKSLLSSNLLDAKTKETLQYVSNLAEEYKKAKAEIDEVVKSLIGDVGNNIMSELVNNFKNGGEDAGEAFRRGFAKSLEKLYEDIIYSAIFGKDLQKMQDRIEKGFETGDMGIMETAMYEFLDGYEQKAEAQQEMMKKLQDYAKSKGIDIWQTDKSTQGSTKSKNSLSGAYAQASQESIDLLSGQTMAFKVAQLQSNVHLKNIEDIAFRNLDYAMQTATNTGATVIELKTAVAELKGINGKMNNNVNNALAAGIG